MHERTTWGSCICAGQLAAEMLSRCSRRDLGSTVSHAIEETSTWVRSFKAELPPLSSLKFGVYTLLFLLFNDFNLDVRTCTDTRLTSMVTISESSHSTKTHRPSHTPVTTPICRKSLHTRT